MSAEIHPAVPPPPNYRRIFVSWTEQWTLQQYVEHYLRERQLPPSAELRSAVNRRIDKYPGRGALKKSDLDYYLDANAVEFTTPRPSAKA
ncbi:MAG TPA: hypothetical protein VII36_11725 [Usitatibacter sp.]